MKGRFIILFSLFFIFGSGLSQASADQIDDMIDYLVNARSVDRLAQVNINDSIEIQFIKLLKGELPTSTNSPATSKKAKKNKKQKENF